MARPDHDRLGVIGLRVGSPGQKPTSLSGKAQKVFFAAGSLINNVAADHPQPLGEFA
jgi:hypothetical protein